VATFNIGQQNAASIQNIGGDAVFQGGIQATASWETLELRRAIAQVRAGLGELALPQPVFEDVNRSLEAAADVAAQPEPDRHDVAGHLGTAAKTLTEAGALVDSGTTVVGSLRRAVTLLGPIGLALVGAL
jgi:hypothetical protein